MNVGAPTLGMMPAKYRADPLNGVHDPQRLKVFQDFLQLTGKVDKVKQEPDGDYHINLSLQPPDTHYLVQGQKDLIVEVIPADQGTVKIPKVGATVTVTGAWVYDTRHRWNEIHPAWSIVPQSK